MVTVGDAVTVVPVVADNPVAGAHVYTSGASPVVPVAVSEVLPPMHILLLADTIGNGPAVLFIPENIVAPVAMTAPDVST